MSKGKKVDALLDESTAKKLSAIISIRGVNQSEAVRLCINEAVILPVGDAFQLSQEFCKIRIALEKENIDREVKEEVLKICRYIGVVLQQAENLVKFPSE